MTLLILSHTRLEHPVTKTLAKNADPDETLQIGASDQGLQCLLPKVQEFLL